MSGRRRRVSGGAAAVLTASALVALIARAPGGSEGYLSGAVTSTAGAKVEGAVVSARIEGEPITTSVFTGADGQYFFPAMKSGSYRVAVQGTGFERQEWIVDLGMRARLDAKLKPNEDPEHLMLQLSGYQVLAALPEDTVAHRRGKAILQKNCTYCHEASTVLRDRFDQAGWEIIIGAMMNAFPKTPPNLTPLQKELAAYLAEMRGPGPSPMKVKAFPRPSGEATLPVVYEYDVQYLNGGYSAHNGSDWRFGNASSAGGAGSIHDAVIDFDGNIWFTATGNSTIRSVGKVDAKTGETHNFALPLGDGTIARSHGMILSPDNKVWFNASPQGVGAPIAHAILGMVDPKTGKVEGFKATGKMTVGGWLSTDAKGNIWTSAGVRGTPPGGAYRFDPRTKTFTEFLSGPRATSTYGITGDYEGGGWWTAVNDDAIEHWSPKVGKVSEIPLPPQLITEYLKPGDIDTIPQPGTGGKQSPRRPGADPHGPDIWVPNWYGNTIVRFDARTEQLKYYPMPYPGMSPYEMVVDNRHNVYVSLQNGNAVARLDPETGRLTIFEWAMHGSAQRNLKILDRDGVVQLSLAAGSGSRVGKMIMRTESDLQALRARAR